MAGNERRPGDWQRKDLRQNANDLVEDDNPKKWYDQAFWIIFFLVIFWPVGIVLVWRSDWHIVVKLLCTVFVAVTVYFAWTMSQAVQAMQVG